MNKMLFAAWLTGMVLLTGCSTPTRVNTGAIRAASFEFVSAASLKKADFAEKNKAAGAMIQDAIANNLTQKGLARVEEGGDIKVAFLVIVGNNVSTMAINDYFGYGRDDAELADIAHKAYAVNSKNPDYFEAGTLLIDLIDARTFKLLLRNYAVQPIQRDAPEDVRKQRIQETVDAALKNLKIKP
jgi:hypothetical protein